MVFEELDSWCQIDLINMQSSPDNEYKFIFVYQDHSIKFIQLRPLTSKKVDEVANVLLEIFTILGAPCVLQSDNGLFIFTQKILFPMIFTRRLFEIFLKIKNFASCDNKSLFDVDRVKDCPRKSKA